MADMIERVARKLAGQAAVDDGYGENSRATAETGEMWKHFHDAARVAIEAMREPTEAMLEACGNGECRKWAAGGWITMIAAALTGNREGEKT